ncbi:hypothetical protein GYMLUDRAFT_47434 [Collybiopsis luxurians FD-317 M1]|uniref:Uncharacterized protein n=1 Tax=Collybiopsis luxurians FD-317 M1 TaxID=944289 RepID=A0A0D0AZ04_9AGAR|nr:hypothetical protein GYMLUDRAFT_47434 [Collybiopsis luxurians FD-317 M1]
MYPSSSFQLFDNPLPRWKTSSRNDAQFPEINSSHEVDRSAMKPICFFANYLWDSSRRNETGALSYSNTRSDTSHDSVLLREDVGP